MVKIEDTRIEIWTKTVAFAAVFVYVCGYLIITIRNANFGFSAGDILKPRILATGTTFLMLCLIPTYLAQRILPLQPSKTTKDLAKWWLALLGYVLEVMSLVFIHSLIVHADPPATTLAHFKWEDLLELGVAVMVVSAASYLLVSGIRHVEKHPKLVIASCLACSTAIW